MVSGRRTTVRVIPEYPYSEGGSHGQKISRCDIWIEIRSAKRYALIIIENKIDYIDAQDQLKRYEGKAKAWSRTHGAAKTLFLYLTPDGRHPSSPDRNRWLLISYLELAAILRNVWLKKTKIEAGRQWLCLYIATITHGVLGMDVNRLTEIDYRKYVLGSVQ